jgi:hypothetical protein
MAEFVVLLSENDVTIAYPDGARMRKDSQVECFEASQQLTRRVSFERVDLPGRIDYSAAQEMAQALSQMGPAVQEYLSHKHLIRQEYLIPFPCAQRLGSVRCTGLQGDTRGLGIFECGLKCFESSQKTRGRINSAWRFR